MTSTLFSPIESAMPAAAELTELVRGQDQALVGRMAPLVRRQSVSLDLSSVQRIDAAGMAALVTLYCDACQAGHRFTVFNASRRVAQMLTLVGLDRILASHNAVQNSQFGPQVEQTAA